MGTEIERKFLLSTEDWRGQVSQSQSMVQGYLADGERCSVRVRIAGDQASLNLKGMTIGASRSEFEYPLSIDDGRYMLEHYCPDRQVEKVRHIVDFGGKRWEIDEFGGRNRGLVVAEIELDSEQEQFLRPPWLGEEVTGEPRYYNLMLADEPYQSWLHD
jgi:adenylate cyclase